MFSQDITFHIILIGYTIPYNPHGINHSILSSWDIPLHIILMHSIPYYPHGRITPSSQYSYIIPLTYILKDNTKEQLTIHRNHVVPYYTKKHIKLELQNYLATNEIPTLKQPIVTTKNKSDKKLSDKELTHHYNLRKKKISLLK